jgi:hypothetical protein
MMGQRMTDDERHTATVEAVTAGLAAWRAGDTPEVNQLLSHAVHNGCTPAELLTEIIAQTEGTP